VVYYRIKQTDKNGLVFYTSVVMLRIKGGKTFEVTPNPFVDNATVNIVSSVKEQAVLNIYDAVGKLVEKRSVILMQGINSFQLQLGYLKPGVYTISLVTADDRWAKVLIKN